LRAAILPRALAYPNGISTMFSRKFLKIKEASSCQT
jgi:hypothetical protein